MKLLFDQNLSYRLCDLLEHNFPDTLHIRKIGMQMATDFEIWEYARKYGYIVVTQDADFYDLSLLHGAPPQIIWLRCGNLKTKGIAELINQNTEQIKLFVSKTQLSCLEIY